MWLDRLSGHSASAGPSPPISRSYSPAPRRASNLTPVSANQRPSFNPRSSSLSLVSNDSTTSLLTSRRNNGPALKQSAVADPPDLATALNKVLGGYGRTAYDSQQSLVDQREALALDGQNFDFGGLTLRQLAREAPGEIHVHSQTVDEYRADTNKFEDLHKSILACDGILNSVEINLTNFQNDLAAVSAEIETLQARSTALGVRLENRKQVESAIAPVVEEISISPAVVKKIVEGTIDEAWVRALAEVEKRSRAMELKAKEFGNVKGLLDLKPLLENLVSKVGSSSPS